MDSIDHHFDMDVKIGPLSERRGGVRMSFVRPNVRPLESG